MDFRDLQITEDEWYALPPCLRHVLTIVDEHVNEATGGEPGTTLTYRFAKAAAAGDASGIVACRILDRINPGHCARALKAGH